MVEGADQLVDGMRPEGVANLGPVEGNANRAVLDGAVLRDVGELEPVDRFPCGRVEKL